MGRSCLNQDLAITSDWSALATWNKHFWTAFWKPLSGTPHLLTYMSPGTEHIAPGNSGAMCRHLAPFLTFLYLSTCNTKLPCFFRNSPKKVFFMNRSVYILRKGEFVTLQKSTSLAARHGSPPLFFFCFLFEVYVKVAEDLKHLCFFL